MSKDLIPVLRLLFWNVGRLPRAEVVAALCAEHEVGVLVLAEWDESPNSITSELVKVSNDLVWTGDEESRLLCFYHPKLELRSVYSDVSRKLVLSEFRWNQTRFLLGAVHLLSPLRTDLADRDAEADNISASIRQQEIEREHSRTIVIGDLNLNPFDRGVAQASGFHAVMSKRQMEVRQRTVQGREYPYFYNPMWGHLGDRTPGPPGTFYYRKSAHLSYDWNTFDQVLLRPDVLDLVDEEVAILDHYGDRSLLDCMGRPDPKVGSDHLPLLVTLRWKGGMH